MTENKPKTRTEATKPDATQHLNEDQKQAMDLHAETEHTDGRRREKLIRKIGKLGEAPASGT
jgi:hypothetical protein